jgi:sec-independent protein translocase protein TatA
MTNTFLIFNFGGGEIMIIVLFIIMFFGSKQIPEIARTLGKGIREVRNATNDIKREIRDQAADVHDSASNMTKGFYDPAKEVKDLAGSVKRGVTDFVNAEPERDTAKDPDVEEKTEEKDRDQDQAST